ncbi:MAG: twin-arginine translocation signal domain-containing protein [Gammaproteobacteria bacterium]
MHTKAKKVKRREFLKGILAMGGATAVTAVTRQADAEEPSTTAESPGQAKGYRESAHVRAYYQSAKF